MSPTVIFYAFTYNQVYSSQQILDLNLISVVLVEWVHMYVFFVMVVNEMQAVQNGGDFFTAFYQSN